MILGSLSWLGRHAAPVLALGVFLGLAAPPLASLLAPLVFPIIILLLTLSLFRLDWQALGALFRRPGIVTVATAWSLTVTPVAAWLVGSAIGLDDGLLIAAVICATAPPIMASAALAQMFDLDAPLSVAIVTLSTILVPFGLIGVTFPLLGLSGDLALDEFAWRAALFIGLPFVLAHGLRRALPVSVRTSHARAFDGGSVLLLLVFAVAIMDGMAARLIDDPVMVGAYLAAAFGLNAGLNVLTTTAFRPLGWHRALTLGLVSGNRNSGLMLGVAGGVAGSDFIVFVAAAQVPIYLMPLIAGPVYRRLARRPAAT